MKDNAFNTQTIHFKNSVFSTSPKIDEQSHVNIETFTETSKSRRILKQEAPIH